MPKVTVQACAMKQPFNGRQHFRRRHVTIGVSDDYNSGIDFTYSITRCAICFHYIRNKLCQRSREITTEEKSKKAVSTARHGR